jgi:hypothetical protein
MGNSFYRQIIFHSTNKLRKNVSLALTILKNDPKLTLNNFPYCVTNLTILCKFLILD